MGVKVILREGEPIASALRRFEERVIQTRRYKGPFRWMREANKARKTKEYHLDPTLLRRMKRVKKRFLAQRWSAMFEGGRPPD